MEETEPEKEQKRWCEQNLGVLVAVEAVGKRSLGALPAPELWKDLLLFRNRVAATYHNHFRSHKSSPIHTTNMVQDFCFFLLSVHLLRSHLLGCGFLLIVFIVGMRMDLGEDSMAWIDGTGTPTLCQAKRKECVPEDNWSTGATSSLIDALGEQYLWLGQGMKHHCKE